MRVVGGIYGGRVLKALEGLNTRPTLDKVKEAMFNIVQFNVADANVLDLFAGSGGLGIECLSRGAKHVIFNDYNKKACEIIQSNIDSLGIKEGYDLFNADYKITINKLVGTNKFDLVLLDPPYKDDITKDIIETLFKNNNLSDKVIVIAETSKETKTQEIPGFSKKEYSYGTVKLSVYRLDR